MYWAISLYVVMWIGMYSITREVYKSQDRLGMLMWTFLWPLVLVLCGIAAVAQTIVNLYKTRNDWMA